MKCLKSILQLVRGKSKSAAGREKSNTAGGKTSVSSKDSAQTRGKSEIYDDGKFEEMCKDFEEKMQNEDFYLYKHDVWKIMNETEKKTFNGLFAKRQWPLTKDWTEEFNKHWKQFLELGTGALTRHGWNAKEDKLEMVIE